MFVWDRMSVDGRDGAEHPRFGIKSWTVGWTWMGIAPAAARLALAGTLLLFTGTESRAAVLVAQVDVSEQVMRIYHEGKIVEEWPVSTARPGKRTPRGKWSAKWLSPNHRSSLYDGTPMPWSVFYNGNFAVHGTDQTDLLGQPASNGCVRLHKENAKKFFDLTRRVGLGNTLIWVRD